MEIIGYFFGGFFIAFLIYQQTKLAYKRYLRTYGTEIKEYLKNKGFDYKGTLSPRNKNWLRSPFPKPQVKTDFLLIRINGAFIKWTNTEYLIIIGQKEYKIQEFWLEIKTTYFQKPILSFRKG